MELVNMIFIQEIFQIESLTLTGNHNIYGTKTKQRLCLWERTMMFMGKNNVSGFSVSNCRQNVQKYSR